MIDNGNHLVLSGNRAVQAYLKRIGAAGALAGPPRAEFAFFDLNDVRAGPCVPATAAPPCWIARVARRVPGSKAGDYLQYAPLLWADKKNA